VDLQPGVYKYQATFSANGQQMAVNVSSTIESGPDGWIATDIVESAMGKGTDVTTLEKGTLLVRKRSIQQGPVSVALDFSGNKASGTMSMNGQERPIAKDLGGPIFADAAGSQQSIACLPLAEGYTATFRNFDVQRQKEKLLQLKVTGVESVTVPAGTFDAYRVEISSADGGNDKMTLWIAKDSRKPVKITAVLAEMGGATLLQELLP
jgi:hypothetical protein